MGQTTQQGFVDDIDGTTAAETVSFALDGVGYEIDLSRGNATALRVMIGRFAAAGRRAGRPSPQRVDIEPSAQAVRAWAAANGHAVPRGGRIPVAVVNAFKEAGN